MWLFCHKFHFDDTLQRYEAHLVVNGKSQWVDIDCYETFSPVVKQTTIRTILSLAVSCGWPIHQLDIKNTSLYGDLYETVYMFQSPDFQDNTRPDNICKPRKSLYGLKQAPRACTTGLLCIFKNVVSEVLSVTLLYLSSNVAHRWFICFYTLMILY